MTVLQDIVEVRKIELLDMSSLGYNESLAHYLYNISNIKSLDYFCPNSVDIIFKNMEQNCIISHQEDDTNYNRILILRRNTDRLIGSKIYDISHPYIQQESTKQVIFNTPQDAYIFSRRPFQNLIKTGTKITNTFINVMETIIKYFDDNTTDDDIFYINLIYDTSYDFLKLTIMNELAIEHISTFIRADADMTNLRLVMESGDDIIEWSINDLDGYIKKLEAEVMDA